MNIGNKVTIDQFVDNTGKIIADAQAIKNLFANLDGLSRELATEKAATVRVKAELGNAQQAIIAEKAVNTQLTKDKVQLVTKRKAKVAVLNARLAKAEANNYTGFSRTVSGVVSLAGGIGAAYLAYNNPEMFIEVLQNLKKEIAQFVLPYAQEIAGFGAGMVGYGISSYLGAPVLFVAMKLIQVIDSMIKALFFRLSVAIIQDIMQDIADLGRFIYKYSTTISLLTTLGVLTYYNPETAMLVVQKALEISFTTTEYSISMASYIMDVITDIATTYGASAARHVVGLVAPYLLPALNCY